VIRLLLKGGGILLVLLSATTQAQPPGGPTPPGMAGMGGGQNPVLILLSPAVQKELKLTDEQKNQVYILAQDSGKRARELFQNAMGPGGNPQANRAPMTELRKNNDRAIAKILKSAQKNRFEEIVLRSEGPMAAARPEIAKKLNVTSAQSQKIQVIMQQMMVSHWQMMMMARQNGIDPNGPRGALREQSATLRENAVQQIAKVLNRKQKDAFNAMLGEPFDLSKIDPDRTSQADQAIKKDAETTDLDKDVKKKSGHK
jgi:Spy/CpxP family protein refolding chaperone